MRVIICLLQLNTPGLCRLQGSIAIGSFIIAVMQFVRILFEWLAARFKQLQVGSPSLV
jgi:hypothetical protein